MNFTGKTKLLGLIGDPVAQARTPILVNQMLNARGKLGEFVLAPMHVPASTLETFVQGMRAMQNFAGAVVTMPHKVCIVPLLDELTPEARLVGAVNVIRRKEDGTLAGTVLDGEGFVSGLEAAGHIVKGKTCLLVGAGGAASAIAFSLAKHQCTSLYLINRTQQKAEALALRVQKEFPQVNVGTMPPPDGQIDIAINATSLGMRPGDALPISEDLILRSVVIAECVVAPETTALLLLAERKGKIIHTGISMLTSQLQLMLDFIGA